MAAETQTFRDRVAELFRSHAGQWLDGQQIAQIGGVYGWRTRVSECRRQLGMTIDNRVRREGRRKVSEYRYAAPDRLF